MPKGPQRASGTSRVPVNSLTWKPVASTSLPHFLSTLNLLYKCFWPWNGGLLALGVSLGLRPRCIFHRNLQIWTPRRSCSRGNLKGAYIVVPSFPSISPKLSETLFSLSGRIRIQRGGSKVPGQVILLFLLLLFLNIMTKLTFVAITAYKYANMYY